MFNSKYINLYIYRIELWFIDIIYGKYIKMFFNSIYVVFLMLYMNVFNYLKNKMVMCM